MTLGLWSRTWGNPGPQAIFQEFLHFVKSHPWLSTFLKQIEIGIMFPAHFIGKLELDKSTTTANSGRMVMTIHTWSLELSYDCGANWRNRVKWHNVLSKQTPVKITQTSQITSTFKILHILILIHHFLIFLFLIIIFQNEYFETLHMDFMITITKESPIIQQRNSFSDKK